ncbi:MAG: hypothetical protein H0X01_09745 [Nitrospira sp.]|nr:hypothetical protein [Nitrospira sp.]
MERRKSEDLYERLQRIPAQDKAQAIVLTAARMARSKIDLVKLIVQAVAKIKSKVQAEDIAPTWAQLLELTPKRFVEIAEGFLVY